MAKLIKTINPRTKGALWLLIAPTALILLVLLGFWLTALLFSGETSLVVATQIILWLLFGLGVITWLPGIIIGVILLNAKK